MLNEAIRTIRESHGESLTKTAKELGVSKSYLSEIENNIKIPSLEMLKKISDHFDIPVSYLLFFSENYGEGEGRIGKITREYLGRKILKVVG